METKEKKVKTKQDKAPELSKMQKNMLEALEKQSKVTKKPISEIVDGKIAFMERRRESLKAEAVHVMNKEDKKDPKKVKAVQDNVFTYLEEMQELKDLKAKIKE